MVFAAILAGGKGKRVGTDLPKQFLKLGSKPVLILTVDAFVCSPCVDFIYIAVQQEWKDHTDSLLREYYDEKTCQRIKTVVGGQERMLSFYNVVCDIRDTYGIHSTDIVLSHDAVRPFVTQEIITDCLNKAHEYGVAMAAIQSADTTYASGKDGYLTATYARETLYLGQTPQGCRMDLMYQVLTSYTRAELKAITGTSQLFINRGIDVKISRGSAENFKITTLQDIEFIKFRSEKSNDRL